jgi:hypothetical protein
MPVDVISAIYAGLVATGGIIGYIKAGKIGLVEITFPFTCHTAI